MVTPPPAQLTQFREQIRIPVPSDWFSEIPDAGPKARDATLI